MLSMASLCWGLLGGLSAVGIEVIFKRLPEMPWWPNLWLLTLPLQGVINLSIWHILQHDSILGVAIWFSASTALLRLAAQGYLGGEIPLLTKYAYGLTILALALKLAEPTR